MTEKIKECIKANRLEEALDEFASIAQGLKDKLMEASIMQQQGRLSHLKTTQQAGIISKTDYDLEQNRIRAVLIQWLMDLKNNTPLSKIPTYQDFNWVLEELAEELAGNHYNVSFGNDMLENHLRPDWRNIFVKMKQFTKKVSKRRNILIVGAGATYSACPYMPYGRQLRAYLDEKPIFKEAAGNYDRLHPIFNIENHLSEMDIDLSPEGKSKLQTHLQSKINNFFNIESYLSELDMQLMPQDKPKLRAVLKEIYNRRYLPIHTYEIIAHLLKHRFIDIVINFNFDELLDQSIEEELGKSDYHKIMHEGDCENLSNILIDGRLKTPIYIKIHGTASVMGSMKFTHTAHRLEVPSQMQAFIKKWIRGQVNDDETDETSRICTNLISVGFDMERAQFSDLLKGNLKKDSKIFQINWKNDSASHITHLQPYYQSTETHKIRHIRLEDWAKIENRNIQLTPMADFWTYLWDKHISTLFKPLFEPRSIARHQIVTDIFYNAFEHGKHGDYEDLKVLKKKNNELYAYFRSSAYFFERTVVEIAITLAQNKGVIEPKEAIKQDRIGQFYHLYKTQLNMELSQNSICDNRKRYCRELYTLNKIYIDCFKLEEGFSFSNHLLNISRFDPTKEIRGTGDTDFIQQLKKLANAEALSNDAFFNLPAYLSALVMYRLFKFTKSQTLKPLFPLIMDIYKNKNYSLILKHLYRNLNKIQESFSHNITPRFRDETVYNFESTNRRDVLHTNLALSYQFYTTFNALDDWDVLLLINERGKFLMSQIAALNHAGLRDKKIIMIGCHEAIAESLNDRDLYDTKPETLKKLAKKYLETLSQNNKPSNMPKIKLYFLPYWRHHHHHALFLKVSDEPMDEYKASFRVDGQHVIEVVQAIYYFKQGFSNKINPLLVPVKINFKREDTRTDAGKRKAMEFIQHDQNSLMDNFIAHYMKAVYFGEKGNSIAVVNRGLSFEYSTQNPDYTPTRADFFKYLKKLHDGEIPFYHKVVEVATSTTFVLYLIH